MKKNNLKLFKYYCRKYFFSILFTFISIFGFISWIYLRDAVKNDIENRLKNNLDYFHGSIIENLDHYKKSLYYIETYLKSESNVNHEKFKNYLENIHDDLVDQNIREIGYISLEDLKENKLKNEFESIINETSNQSGIYSMLPRIGVLKSLSSKSKLENSKSGTLLPQTLVLLIPYWGNLGIPIIQQSRLENIRGFLYVPIKSYQFFSQASKFSQIHHDSLSFEVDSLSSKSPVALYKQYSFPPNNKNYELSKIINVYGQNWKLTIKALPPFFTFNDLYLTNTVAGLFLLCIILLTFIFFQTNKIIKQEKKTKLIINDSNQVKAAFLANMSHEIRTPLNAINGFSEVLSHTADPEEKKYLIQNIRKNCFELTNYIENILDISKIEFGRIFIEKQNVKLVALIEQVKETMTARAQAKGLSFSIESIGKLPTEVYLDKSRIHQILINLIGNAIKFTDKGYVKLQIEAEVSTSRKAYLLFTISDTGIGISSPDQLDLFQSFSQVDDSNTRRYGGLGLGLALSRRLAHQFAGEVKLIKSQINQGSVFCLKLPLENYFMKDWKDDLLSQISQQSVQLNLPYDIDLNKKCVLLVEDSIDNQEIFKYFLSTAGSIVDVAENGEIAVTKMVHSKYDFILMDIQLPIMDGLQATRIIRSMGYDKPIIALTAHASAEAKNNCLKAGCTSVINKPITQETLLQNILYILEENKIKENTNDIQELHS